MLNDSRQADHGTITDVSESRRPLRSRGYAVAAGGAIIALGIAIWLSTLVDAGPTGHRVALFAHLGFMTLGFGAVLVADYSFALWVLRRATFAEAVASTAKLHPLIWAGLCGLVVSGVLLRPDLTSSATILKLALVATLTLNGVQAMALGERMSTLRGTPPMPLLLWGGVTSAVSQACWWGAIIIGYLNASR
ncbi:hypothetical protein [Dactylosporangium matsuzakiense]|uniref:Uncharacterized protein n=1 Tax=Dactylosporangium matsuzakiense TaxID=53360 RepID=A0A9W6KKV2_9ACTN|nr:hypothetical protein [Dactylosporangium matsuzakiense]UWZ48679.1 hypothetical protein Dmats_21100 [Dactylosporangium matsuzakiense]GLL03048.1 hypothetical protein GCM10017581_047910 [Dactylosporangium matsuzakiense]